MKLPRHSLTAAAVIAALIIAAILSMVPRGIQVEPGTVDRGRMEVTIREDGKTRIKERYTISAPLAGKLERLHWRAGDAVRKAEDVVAVIVPGDPALLDPSARAQAEARVRAAEALRSQTASRLERARVNHEYARANLERVRELLQSKAVSHQDVDNAEESELSTGHLLKETEFAARVADFELEQAQAVLLRAEIPNGTTAASRHEIHAPVAGSILRVFQESSTIVTPGARLLEIGDPGELEIEVDVLSTDAVRVKPGARVSIEHWGGGKPLTGRVRLVEPSAFTKVSALGVEEQRVNVIIDFVSPAADRPTLGDGFRVEVRIVVWEAPDVLRVPAGALFRDGDQWAVFTVENGKAAMRTIETGQISDDHAQVLKGLSEGDQVILYPSDLIEEGAGVRIRK